MRKLKDAVALVTGASSGIGYAAARSLARRGVHTVLTARRADRLRSLAGEIAALENAPETLILPADLNASGEAERIADAAEAWKGRVDILVNNAGFGRIRFLEELDSAADILPQLNLDLAVPILLTRALLPGMIRRRTGCIINIDSVAGLTAMPTFTIYSAAKWGLRGFNDALRREAKPYGIDVCLVCPGPVRTEFGLHTGRQSGWEDRIAGRMTVEVEELGELVARLVRHPRRSIVIPWYFRLAVVLTAHLPGLTDFFVERLYAKERAKTEPSEAV